MTTPPLSPVPSAPTPGTEPENFSWHRIPRRIRLAMKHHLGLKGDPEGVLADRFGTPPSADVVDACWPVLCDDWLGATTGAHPRRRIVAALRAAGLGDQQVSTSTRTGQVAYLQSLDPSTRWRDVVHEELVLVDFDRLDRGYPCEAEPDPDNDPTRVDHLLDPTDPEPSRCPACGVPAVPIAYGFPSFRVADHGIHQPDDPAMVIDAIPKPSPGSHLVLPLLHRLTVYLAGAKVAA